MAYSASYMRTVKRASLSSIKERLTYESGCHFEGYCPTQEEIDYTKTLSKRVKGKTTVETIVNILEWQDKNINFWDERHPFPLLIVGSVVFFMVAFFPIAGLFWLILLLFGTQFSFSITILIGITALISSLITIMASITVLIRYNRKIPLRSAICNIIKPSISMQLLLGRDKKLGVCRDYSKLTACLLKNNEPNSSICFVRTQGHVATGISVNGSLYMLDQHLPILTITQWCYEEYGSNYKKKIQFPYGNVYQLIDNRLISMPLKTFLFDDSDASTKSLNDLTSKIKEILQIRKDAILDKNNYASVELPRWKHGADIYSMNDEIVNYSLARRIKKQLTNELIDLEKVVDIQTKIDKHHNHDLVFTILINL